MPTKSLVHANNNLVCAVDVETTGTEIGWHEMIQVVFLPLDNNLNARKDLPPFDIRLRPNYLERIDLESMKVNRSQLQTILDTGIDQEKGIDLFEHWFQKLKLADGKRIMPLGHNIALFDLPFIREWMGPKMFNSYMSYVIRDTMTVCNFLNDVSDVEAEQTPFNKLRLSYVAKKLDIEIFDQGTHDALYDAHISAEVYKKLMSHHLLDVIGVINGQS